ncbi:hypothetical protein [Methanobrevibacter sp.]|uniref:hypothetical protein n=1 Tax=Methanobrevibacter sp. TaxID=66852 RepID=UPI0025F2AC86|nr:hypothetical protein [Methanobrevibacter sp.]MBQ2962297.1 hypothetical protein [Methanobrevibacter sp.]
MLNKKLIIGFIIALIALVVVGFIALNFVPTTDVLDLNLTDNAENVAENITNDTVISEDLSNDTESEVNGTEIADENDTDTVDANDTNASSDDIDAGDVLKKQTFIVTENDAGQFEGMEPGTYVFYYTQNDGIIKIDKVA